MTVEISEEVRLSDRDIDQFFALSIEMLTITGFDGYFKRLNPVWERVLGFTLEELMAEPFMNFVHPDDRAPTEFLCRDAAGGTEILSFKNRYRCRDGTYRLLEWTGATLASRQLFFTAARDITDRDREQERLAHLLNSTRVVLFSRRAEGDCSVTFVSENITDQTGHKPSEFMAGPEFWSDHIHPEDRAQATNNLASVLQHGHVSHEYRFRHKNGSYLWVQSESKVRRDAQGNPVEIIGTWLDITERRRSEDLIQKQATALRELSTPLIPINDRVLVMPLIGTMDSQRANQVLDTLLTGVSERRASVAILDITGVSVVDTQVANALLTAAKAVRLLGAEVVLTGIRPDVAHTLVGLGVDMAGIVTRGTLQAGIAYAMDPDRARSFIPGNG